MKYRCLSDGTKGVKLTPPHVHTHPKKKPGVTSYRSSRPTKDGGGGSRWPPVSPRVAPQLFYESLKSFFNNINQRVSIFYVLHCYIGYPR